MLLGSASASQEAVRQRYGLDNEITIRQERALSRTRRVTNVPRRRHTATDLCLQFASSIEQCKNSDRRLTRSDLNGSRP